MEDLEEEKTRELRQALQDECKETSQRRRDFEKTIADTLASQPDTNPAIGFIDESSIRSDPTRRRVINTRVVKYTDGDPKKKRSRTVFGFMALNGNDVAMVSESAKKEEMISFIEIVRKENPGGSIVIILDNARIHTALEVRTKAIELGVYFAFLPPYSPDLQPIEFGWKDLKREISGFLNFEEAASKSERMALNLFRTRKLSYSRHWRETFIESRS